MDGTRFDALARLIGRGPTRRGVLRLLLGGAVGGALVQQENDTADAACRKSYRRGPCRDNRDCCPGFACCRNGSCCKETSRCCPESYGYPCCKEKCCPPGSFNSCCPARFTCCAAGLAAGCCGPKNPVCCPPAPIRPDLPGGYCCPTGTECCNSGNGCCAITANGTRIALADPAPPVQGEG